MDIGIDERKAWSTTVNSSDGPWKQRLPSFDNFLHLTAQHEPIENTTASPEVVPIRHSTDESSAFTSCATKSATIKSDGEIPIREVTKAGKIRKRSAFVCSACRRRKVKCEYRLPKCSQCREFNRECSFTTSRRQEYPLPWKSHNLLEPPASANVTVAQKNFSEESMRASTQSNSSNQAIDYYRPHTSRPTDLDSKRKLAGSIPYDATSHGHPIYQCFLDLEDPVESVPSLSQTYISAFNNFVRLNGLEALPRKEFTEWVIHSHNKSLCEKLVVYAVMAVGTFYTSEPGRVAHRRVSTEILHSELDRVDDNSNSLLHIHILLFLTLIHLADAEYERGYNVFVRAANFVSRLHPDGKETRLPDDLAYKFSTKVYTDCRRRTHRLALTIDTYISMTRNCPPMLRTTDPRMRIPCATHLHKADDPSNASLLVREMNFHAELANVDHLPCVISLFRQIQIDVWHSSQYDNDECEYQQHLYLRRIRQQYLEAMSSTCCTESQDLTGVRLMYHYTCMVSYQRVNHKRPVAADFIEHAKLANFHAVEVLRLAQRIVMRQELEADDYVRAMGGPLGGYAVLTAIDIVTAVGRVSDILGNQSVIMTLMYCGLELLNALSKYWSTAETQRSLVAKRIQTVFIAAQTASTQKQKFFYCTSSMVTSPDRRSDFIYGSDRQEYLRAAFNVDATIPEHEIFVVSTYEERMTTAIRSTKT